MADDLETVAAYRYVSFTTFRKSGDPVSTPVWIARSGPELVFVSEDGVGKIKRLARNRAVELRPCSMRGVVEEGAAVHRGTATLHRDSASLKRTRAALGSKYPEARLSNVLLGVLSRVGLMKTPRVAVVITLDA